MKSPRIVNLNRAGEGARRAFFEPEVARSRSDPEGVAENSAPSGWRHVALPYLITALLLLLQVAAGAAEFRFKGTAVDSYDRPLPGASVRLYFEEAQAPVPVRLIVKTNTVSAADGTFELSIPRGHGYIVATKPGFGAAWRLWNEIGEPDEIAGRLKLYEGASVSGTVADEKGNPEAGAEVYVTDAYFGREYGAQVYDYVASPWLRDCLSARTGPDGRFRIEGIPRDSTFNLAVAKPGKVLRKKSRGRASASLNSMLCVDGETGVRLTTELSGRVEGRVALPAGAGAPPRETWLWLQDQDRNRLVDRQWVQPRAGGTYQFADVAPGSYWVHAGFGTNTLSDWVADSAEVTVLGGETNDDVNINATRGGIIEISVTRTNGGGPEADVSFATFRQSFQTAGGPAVGGLMQTRHPASACQFELWRGGYRIKRTNIEVHFDRTNRFDFVVEPPSRVDGIATNRQGAPVAGAKVFVFPACGSCSQAAARTGTNGYYSIYWDLNSKVGKDPFFLFARDITRDLAGCVDVDPDETDYDLFMDKGLAIKGRVQDAEGRPVTNAFVRLAVWSGQGGDWFDENNPPRIDADGWFEFPALPRDRIYSVRACARGYGEADSKRISGDTDSSTEIQIPPLILAAADREIAGRVVDPGDKPVPWADVFVNAPGQPGHHARADVSGVFRVDQLCPGKVTVSAISRYHRNLQECQAGDTNLVITIGQEDAIAPTAPAPAPEAAPLGVPWSPWQLRAP